MRAIILFICLTLLSPAQDVAKEELIGLLFETREPAAFEAIYKKAQENGISQQALLEARFLYLVDTGNDSDLAKYSQKLQLHLPEVKIEESVIFSVPEDYQAIVEYTLALAALEKGSLSGFKKHIQEAFWLSPSQAAVFGRHVDKIRLKNAMAQLKLDLTQKLTPQGKDKGEAKTLQHHLGKAPALLLHFWSPWARESLDSMPDFFATASELKKHQLPVISILLAGNEESRNAGDDYLKEQGKKAPGLWLRDNSKGSLASTFRVQAFPTIILVAKDGSILFNGHPIQPEFWAALKKLAPDIQRPDLPEK